ncbi:MAG: efflux transporter periplasmic adaptor subunit, partial [Flavobacteriaceae bacterium]
MKQLLYPIVWILIVSTFACGNLEKKPPEVKGMAKDKIVVSKLQFENNGMELGSTTKQAFPEVVNVRGMIDVPPENRAIISATMGGYVKETPWLIGDQVRKGQALVTLE